MLGSLTAIIFAGMLNYVGKRYPHLTGEGRLQPGEDDDMDPVQEEITRPRRRDPHCGGRHHRASRCTCSG